MARELVARSHLNSLGVFYCPDVREIFATPPLGDTQRMLCS